MFRPHFLITLFVLAGLLLDVNPLAAQSRGDYSPSGTESLTVFRSNSARSVRVPLRSKHKTAFVNARELAEALNYNTYFNDEKKKLVLYLPQNKVILTGNNPFVIIDGKTLQIPIFTLLDGNDIFVPLVYLVPLINRYANLNLNYDNTRQVLRIGEGRYNIAGVDVDAKENGVVIRIRTSKVFKKGEMTVDMRYNWMHVDLYGGNADTELIAKTPAAGPVREVKAFQFETLLSVAFRLSKEPLSKEIYQDESAGEVVVVLRYKEQITASVPPEKAEIDSPILENDTALSDNNDNIQKQLEQERKRWLIDTIVIDPGHGGKDPGALGVDGLKEKDVVLAIALKLGNLIKKRMPGVKVIYTRKNDTFVELRRRTQIANENKAKVFISIHANANKSSRAGGFEAYILGPNKGDKASNVASRENAVIKFESPDNQKHYKGINVILAGLAQTAFMRQSEHLADNVQKEMSKRLRSLNIKTRGVKQAGFWVMVGASMPSVLIETGFVTNKYDARILKTAGHQQKVAEGIFSGLQQFVKDYESAI